MTHESDRAYLEKRAREERQQAERSSDPCAYKTHLELARQYERRLTALLQHGGEEAAERARPDILPRTPEPII